MKKWSVLLLFFSFSILGMERAHLPKAASYPSFETPVQKKEDPHIKKEEANALLSKAITFTEFETALKSGADVNSRDEWERTALNRAISFPSNQHKHEIIQLLLKHEANPKEYDEQINPDPDSGQLITTKLNNALHIAAKQKCMECCNLIMKHVAQLTPVQKKCIFTLLLVLHRKRQYQRGLQNIYREFQKLLLPHLMDIYKIENIESTLIPFLEMKNSNGELACKFYKENLALLPATWKDALHVKKQFEETQNESCENEHTNQE